MNQPRQNARFEEAGKAAAAARWYACYTRGKHEKQVDRMLGERGVETYLPLVDRLSRWKDRQKLVSFVLFPSYVFARFPADDLYRVLAVPGVASVVRNNGRLVAISDEDIENVRRFAAALSRTDLPAELVPLPAAGERVRIKSGPFEGIEGLVVEHRKRSRVLVGLDAIGCGLQLELESVVLEVIPS